MGKGEGQRRWEMERKSPLQRSGHDMVMLSTEAEGVSLPEVKAAAPWPQWLSWPHLLSLAMVAEAGDQKELPAGQEGGCCLVCANPGPEVFRGTKRTSRRGRQSCTVDELIS